MKNPRSNKGATVSVRFKNHIYDQMLDKADEKYESITDFITRLVKKEISK